MANNGMKWTVAALVGIIMAGGGIVYEFATIADEVSDHCTAFDEIKPQVAALDDEIHGLDTDVKRSQDKIERLEETLKRIEATQDVVTTNQHTIIGLLQDQ